MSPLQPSVLYTVLCPFCCPLFSPLSPLWPCVSSAALCTRYRPLSPLQPCFLYGLLSPLGPFVPSTALCPPLYGPLSPLQPSVHFTDFCQFDVSVPPLWPTVPFTAPAPSKALCNLYGSPYPLQNGSAHNDPMSPLH